jgi:sarcosine oxidase subunit gamma
MADLTTLRRNPLEHLAEQMASASRPDIVGLAEVPHTAMVGLRVDPAAPAGGRAADVLGAPLPISCGGVIGMGAHRALWLGPDEWLVTTTADADVLVDQLTAAMGEEPGLALDLSANRTVLELSGPRAREVLEKGCPADLHPRTFGVGQAVSTTLARVPVLLWQTDVDGWRLLPRSSFADYVARWLLDAMVEFTG